MIKKFPKYDALFLGAGRLAEYFFQKESTRGWGIVRRTPGPQINICGDLNRLNLKSWEPVNLIVIALTPDSSEKTAYEHLYSSLLLKILQELRYKRIIFISSTRVYADTNSQWVDEDGELSLEWGAQALLTAEQAIRMHSFKEHIIIRASGLYETTKQPPSNWLQNNRWANRLHYADLARLLRFCATLEGPVQLTVNASDHSPFIPSNIATSFKALRESASQFHSRPSKSNKISNLLSRSLGFIYKYPSILEAYKKDNPSLLI